MVSYMVSIRGWIILHAFHFPVFSACVVVDFVTGSSIAFSTLPGRSVSRGRSWVNRSCWGCCAHGVNYCCYRAADAVPAGDQRRSGLMDFEVCTRPKWSKMHVRQQIVHNGPFCASFGPHSGPFSTIRRNSRTMPMSAKGVPRVEGTPRNTPLFLPMASGLFTGRSRRSARPVDRSSRRGHWTRRS